MFKMRSKNNNNLKWLRQEDTSNLTLTLTLTLKKYRISPKFWGVLIVLNSKKRKEEKIKRSQRENNTYEKVNDDF